MKTPFLKKRSRGFTLIELMVAMAITTVIVTVLVSITGVALDTWQRGRAEIRASRQAKSMLDTMAKDFESLVSRRGNNFEWLYSKVDTELPGPTANVSSNAAELIFFTAATDRYFGEIGTDKDLGGDVSCVGYKLEYQKKRNVDLHGKNGLITHRVCMTLTTRGMYKFAQRREKKEQTAHTFLFRLARTRMAADISLDVRCFTRGFGDAGFVLCV